LKTNIHFWSNLAHFFLECKMFHTKVVEKIKTNIFCSITFFFENRAVCQIMWKNSAERGRQQTTIWRMRTACWLPKATNTLKIFNTQLLFHCNNGCTNAPPCYFIHALPLSFSFISNYFAICMPDKWNGQELWKVFYEDQNICTICSTKIKRSESPELEVTWHTVAIIIRVVLLSPYLCIRGVSLSSIRYNQSLHVYINQTPIGLHSLNLKLKLKVINFPRRVAC
jgi:hypothetical protein